MKQSEPLSTEMIRSGLVKVEGMVAPHDVHAARDRVLALANEHGLFSEGRWMHSPSSFGYPKPFRNALNALNYDPTFPDLLGAPVQTMVEGILGQGVMPLPPGQQLLFTLPGQQDWQVPHDVWHLDMPRLGEDASPGLQAFTFLEDVDPGGGATLVVAGSHRLLNGDQFLKSKQVKQKLAAEPFFRWLFDPARTPITNPAEAKGQMHGVDLQVVELCGKVGDVFLMDLRVLHTPAPNCSETARIMATCRYPVLSAAAMLGAAA
ncbi:phytanoyl-CoA dioxygenase family protein [Parerythrobacter aestuarii]|uniref:phytanoyl-CoA dioxygenase family protein n=1 Tax=Parerythrobacter aestuarii TaxID=3020909 RepID=UPI0024DE7F0A|nr:phytanoyl-CoA dioxygenase family protein [Parerythrobacter aestuarii]